MDKNTITGFLLIALILIGFSWYNSPSEEEKAKMEQQRKEQVENQKKQEAEAKAQQAKAKEAAVAQAKADSTFVLFSATQGTAKDIVLENEKVALTVSTKGGMVNKAVIKGYKNNFDKTNNVTTFDAKDQTLEFTIDGKEHNINTANLYFTPVKASKNELTLEAGNGAAKLIIEYKLGKDYMLHAQFRAQGMQGFFPSACNSMNIKWMQNCRQQEKGRTFENRYASLTYHEVEGGTDYLSETANDEETPEDPIDWVAFKNQFFSSVMIVKDNFLAGSNLKSLKNENKGYLKTYDASLKAAFDPTGAKATEFEFYYGPNDFQTLQDVEEESSFGKDLELERLVYLGWPLFRIINRWFTLYVFDWLTKMSIPMGIVLILLTLILKVITYPMVKKSFLSSAKMRVLKPKLEEATKHLTKKEDAMQKQQIMMQMYSKYGVSPMSGCLPMLIQMPIWIAMFNFVPNAIQLRGQSFLWIDDLSAYDVLFEWSNPIWLIGDHLSLTCILFCGSNILYSWFTMRQQRDQMVGEQAQQMKMMQYMMFLMPLMFFFMFNDYSAGLNFYYFVSLFCSAAVMFILRKTTNDEKLLAQLEAKYKENEANPKKMTGLAAQLEKMQKQQQEMERKRQELYNKRKGL